MDCMYSPESLLSGSKFHAWEDDLGEDSPNFGVMIFQMSFSVANTALCAVLENILALYICLIQVVKVLTVKFSSENP